MTESCGFIFILRVKQSASSPSQNHANPSDCNDCWESLHELGALSDGQHLLTLRACTHDKISMQ